MQPCLPGPLKPCLPNPRRRIQEKQAAKRLADLNMQNVETQAYDAEAAMQVWGDKLAGASMAVDETLEAPCGADVGQPEEPIPETEVVLTPPRKKLPQPPSPLAPSPCCLALSKQGSLNLDPLQDSQMPLEAPTNSPAAEQPDSTFAAEKEGPAPDKPDRTFAAEKEAAAPDLPDLSGMAAVPHQSPEKPSLTHAPKRANPHPDEANTRVAEDDLSTSTAKVGEASVESSNLLQVAQAANLALQAAMQALSLEPDQGAPCPMRVEQFEMRDEGKPPRGRGRGKGRGKGTGRGKGGKGRGRGAAKNMVRPEGPENDEPIDVELWGEPVPENVPSEPEAEPQQTAKARGKRKRPPNQKKNQKQKQKQRRKPGQRLPQWRVRWQLRKPSQRRTAMMVRSPSFLVGSAVRWLPNSLVCKPLSLNLATVTLRESQGVSRGAVPLQPSRGVSSPRRILRRPGLKPSAMCSGKLWPRSWRRWGRASALTRTVFLVLGLLLVWCCIDHV